MTNSVNSGKGIREKKCLTEKEEHYCQLRAQGNTMTKSASIAFDTKHPGQLGSNTEKQKMVQARIRELQDEYAEAYGLDFGEQVRRYNEMYHEAYNSGDIKTALLVMQRLDSLGGFEVKRSEVTRKDAGASLRDKDGDTNKDLERFSNLLNKHSDATSGENGGETKH